MHAYLGNHILGTKWSKYRPLNNEVTKVGQICWVNRGDLGKNALGIVKCQVFGNNFFFVKSVKYLETKALFDIDFLYHLTS